MLSLVKHIERPTIFEIGGGYGGLIREVLLRRQVRYINCDLPETLYLAYFFLRNAMPHLSIKWIDEDMAGADVVLVPSGKRGAVTACDVAFNCHSLSEMGKDTVADYVGLINRLNHSSSCIKIVTLFSTRTCLRHIEIRARDFPVDPDMLTLKTRTISPWHGGGGRYREFLFQPADRYRRRRFREASRSMAFASTIEIDGHTIGKDEPTYFIADIGANFDGDLGKAKKLAYEVKQAGAQVAKIQSFQANKIVSGAGFASMRLKGVHGSWGRPVDEVFKEAEFPRAWHQAFSTTAGRSASHRVRRRTTTRRST